VIPKKLVDLYHVKIELRQYEVRDDWLFIRNRLYVFYYNEIRTRIIKKIHELLPGGHAKRESTYTKISKEYYWLKIIDLISRYVKSYHVYKKLKLYRNGKYRLLNSLPILNKY
jgi:hypothetical protein